MRILETIALLNVVIGEIPTISNYIIDAYSWEETSEGVVSSVSAIFPAGRDHTAIVSEKLAENMPEYKLLPSPYRERFSSSLPVALTGIQFNFSWTDSIGGV